MPVQQFAGFVPQQLLGFDQTQQYAQSGQPLFQQAAQYFNQSASPISGQQISNYMNPYAAYVLGNLKETQGQQMQDLTGRLTQQAGGVGANRIGVGQAELARQQNDIVGQTLSGIYGQALSAAQQDAQRQQAAAYGMGNLGATAQGAALQGAQANFGMGTAQQNLTQQQLNALYTNKIQQLAYPYQNTQYLAGITGGLAGALGGTTSGYAFGQPPVASPLSNLAALGQIGTGVAGVAGAFGNTGGTTPTGATYGGYDASGNSLGYGSIGGVQYPAYAAHGGRIGYDDGGGVQSPDWMHSDPYIPNMPVQSQAHHPELHFSQPQSGSGSSGNSDLSNIAAIGKAAATILPLLPLSQGGAVENPFEAYYQGGHYQEGGDVDFNSRFGDWLRTRGTGDYSDYEITKPAPERPPLPRPRPPTAPQLEGVPIRTGSGSRAEPYRLEGTYDPLMNSNDTSIQAAQVAGRPRVNVMGGTTQAPPPAPAAEPEFKPVPPDVSNIRRALSGPVPYPDVNPSTDVSRGFAKSPWMALIASGFGTLAGGSPYAGVNIGKGGLEGIKTLMGQREALQSEEAINQRARQLALSAEKEIDALTKVPVEAQQRINIEQQRLDQSKLQKLFENVADGTTVFKDISSGKYLKVGPDGPQEMTAEDFARAAQASHLKAQSPEEVPSTPPPLGVDELASHNEAPALPTPGLVKGRMPIIAKQTNMIDQEIQKKAATLPDLQDNLLHMKQAYATLMADRDKDGFLTQLLTTPGQAFLFGRGLGNHPDTITGRIERAKELNTASGGTLVNPRKLAAAEEMAKIQSRMGATFAAQISSRPAFKMEQIGINATPGFTNTPLGFLELMPAFDAAAMNTKDQIEHWASFQSKNWHSPSQWRTEFMRTHTPDMYYARSVLENIPNKAIKDKLPSAVEYLKKNPTPENIAEFNKRYHGTASFFLTGKVAPYEGGTP